MMNRPVLIGLALLVACATAAGCSEGGYGGDNDDEQVSEDAEVQSDGDGGTVDNDGGNGDTDEGDAGGTSDNPKVEAFTNCGAGGVSKGEGLQAVQCYGPSEASDREPTGSGVTWQPGAFRVITE